MYRTCLDNPWLCFLVIPSVRQASLVPDEEWQEFSESVYFYMAEYVNDDGAPYCLHGLNAVFLPEHGWYRIDARGNRPGVDARFEPPVERLAFPLDLPGERDLPGYYPDPLPEVVAALTAYDDAQVLLKHLPDRE